MSSTPLKPDSTARTAPDYWAESRRPLTALVFIAPLLVVYELGVLMLGPEAVRNGADVWLRELLNWMGFGQYFLLPVLTACILLGWHHTTRQPWRLSSGVLWGMVVECALLTCGLWLILEALQSAFGPIGHVEPRTGIVLSISETVRQTIGFLGAGVYEELLFRLILLLTVAWLARCLGATGGVDVVTAVVLTSLAFAAAHHVGPHGEPWEWFSFTFRTVAGGFFSVLFVYRGFGIAAGTHVGYDILVGLC